jgi:uncharacterized protein (DUF1800 family)
MSLDTSTSHAPSQDGVLATAEEQPTRRRFFSVGISLAAASVAAASTAGAQTGDPPPKKGGLRGMVRKLLDSPPDPAFAPFKKQTASTRGWDSALTRLVRSATNGVTDEELKLAQKLGFYGYLNYQLQPTRIADSAVQTFVTSNYPLLEQQVEQLYNIDQRMVYDQLVESNVYRAAFSNRQLYERMVEFWSDHFNISFNEVRYLMLVDQRDVIRKNALGNFGTMLKASAHSAAMLEYLDNTRNRRTTLNENYAREIMELHTMGADGGYSQTDVRELARCLTGWTLAGRGTFNFDPNGHDFGAKTVLGYNIASLPTSSGAQGKTDGDFMLDILINHPSTARYVAKKMLRFLLQYDPTQAQINAVAQTYTRTKADIPSMIRSVLTPANLLAAAPKYKRPYTFMLSAMRATVDPSSVAKVSLLSDRYLTALGQPMFQWDPPDGYPDRAEYWAGGILQRWNFANYIATTSSTEAKMDFGRFSADKTPDGVANALSKHLFGGEMPDALKTQLVSYASAGTLSDARIRETIALALSSSTFNWL